MRTLYWDVEARSAVNLRECGAFIYATATTQVLCLVYAIDDENTQLWLTTDPPPPVFLEIAAAPSDWRLIAHNWPADPAGNTIRQPKSGAGQRLSG
jgi:hypothetical protein